MLLVIPSLVTLAGSSDRGVRICAIRALANLAASKDVHAQFILNRKCRRLVVFVAKLLRNVMNCRHSYANNECTERQRTRKQHSHARINRLRNHVRKLGSDPRYLSLPTLVLVRFNILLVADLCQPDLVRDLLNVACSEASEVRFSFVLRFRCLIHLSTLVSYCAPCNVGVGKYYLSR